jgi:hypothetical protein
MPKFYLTSTARTSRVLTLSSRLSSKDEMTGNDTQLNEAEALARFANLQPEDIKSFRQMYPDFAPEGIWDSPALSIPSGQMPESVPTWKIFQKSVQEIWANKFPPENIVEFIAAVAEVSKGYKQVKELAEMLSKKVLTYSLPKPEIFACQRAMMFLGVQPWRALFCGVCGKRFIADKPGRKYCSEECAEKTRKGSKLAWWNKHGQELRNAKAKQSKTRRKR